MDKLAFLFLVSKDLNQRELWERYFHKYELYYNIYCHAKNAEKIETPLLKDNIIDTWVSTEWGNIGLVIAQIELLRDALKDESNKMFFLCSESCIPIKTFKQTYRITTSLNLTWCISETKHTQRMARVYNFNKEDRRKNSQWVALNRKHAELLVRNNYVADFANCIIPDEHYVASVLTKHGFENELFQVHQTCVSWHRISPVQFSPMEHTNITNEFVNKWRNSRSLFARKILEDSDVYHRWFNIVGE